MNKNAPTIFSPAFILYFTRLSMKLLVCFILSLQKVSHNHGLTFRQPFKYDVLKVEIFREITKRSLRKKIQVISYSHFATSRPNIPKNTLDKNNMNRIFERFYKGNKFNSSKNRIRIKPSYRTDHHI